MATSPLTLTTAGTRQPVLAAADYTDSTTGTPRPTLRYCNRCTFQWISGTTIYLGLQLPRGSADSVSSTVYDIALSATNPAFTVGPIGEQSNDVDLGGIYWDSDTNGAKMTFAPVTV